jgi:glutathione peroxidase
MSFGLDMPMADISHVKGAGAHGFYKEVKAQTGFAPNWNFNKVLIGPEGDVVGTWRSNTKPQSRKILRAIEPLLN